MPPSWVSHPWKDCEYSEPTLSLPVYWACDRSATTWCWAPLGPCVVPEESASMMK